MSWPKGSQAINVYNSQFDISLFIGFPLGLRFIISYSSLIEYRGKEVKGFLSRGDCPIDFNCLYAVKDYKDTLKLMEILEHAIIKAGSGMCMGGRIKDNLKTTLGDPKNEPDAPTKPHFTFCAYHCNGWLLL